MADNLFAPPPEYVLPLSLGGDLSVNFRNNPSGDDTSFVDYGPGVTVTLIVGDVQAAAVVSGHDAVVKVESQIADVIPDRAKWRLVVSSPPSTEVVAAFGKVKRFG